MGNMKKEISGINLFIDFREIVAMSIEAAQNFKSEVVADGTPQGKVIRTVIDSFEVNALLKNGAQFKLYKTDNLDAAKKFVIENWFKD